MINVCVFQPEHQTEDLLALTESWFHHLSREPMDMIRNISTQPFPELHCGALAIFNVSAEMNVFTIFISFILLMCNLLYGLFFKAIGAQPWGQRLMMSTPGFMEFILDRSTGHTKEAKDAKFELVGSLVSSSTAADILGSQNYIRLKSYLIEGAYYISAVATVSTEGAE